MTTKETLAPPSTLDTSAEDSPSASVSVKDDPKILYPTWKLKIYDTFVLGLVGSLAWNCPTKKYLLPQYRSNVSTVSHIDIGNGSGYYLAKGKIPASTKLTFVDLEKGPLALAVKRSGRKDARTIQADILSPLPLPTEKEEGKFESVSMYYLLHCIPASMDQKCAIFKHIKRNMTKDGVLHGCTVLGKGVRKDGKFAALVRGILLKKGVFNNSEDNAFGFERVLREEFAEVQTRVVGTVFVFWARGPKNGTE